MGFRAQTSHTTLEKKERKTKIESKGERRKITRKVKGREKGNMLTSGPSHSP